MSCPTTSAPASDNATTAPPVRGTVRTIRICPPVSGTTQAPVGKAVDLTVAQDGATFEALLAALSLPDVPATRTATACPVVARLPTFEVLIDTTEGQWSPHLPVDGCKRWIQPLTAAIQAATG
jgi:hypothetical protein